MRLLMDTMRPLMMEEAEAAVKGLVSPARKIHQRQGQNPSVRRPEPYNDSYRSDRMDFPLDQFHTASEPMKNDP